MKLFKRKNKQTKTNFLSAKVISVNDMLWHTFRLSKYLESDSVGYLKYDIETARKYINDKLDNDECLFSGNIIILFTFSDNYLVDCTELLSAISTTSAATDFKINNSDTGKIKLIKHKDKDGITKSLGRANVNTNYLLVSANPYDLINLISNINSLSNPLLLEIIDIIYDYIDHSLFRKLIDDGILELGKFKSFNEPDPLYIARNSSVIEEDNQTYYISDYDNVDDILLKLPSVFSSIDLSRMFTISFSNRDDKEYFMDYTLYGLLHSIHYDKFTNDYDTLEKVVDNSKIYYDNIIKGVYRLKDMKSILEPLYNRDEDNEDLITGKSEDVDEEYINEIKGANVYSPLLENQAELVNIDEELSEDDPEYNQVDEELKK